MFVNGASIRSARVLQGKAGSLHATRDVDELDLFATSSTSGASFIALLVRSYDDHFLSRYYYVIDSPTAVTLHDCSLLQYPTIP